MRILLDHCTPRPLASALGGDHTVDTARSQRCDTLSNGDLLRYAEQHGYDLLITTDRDFRNRGVLASRTTAVLLLLPNRWPTISDRLDTVRAAFARSAATVPTDLAKVSRSVSQAAAMQQ